MKRSAIHIQPVTWSEILWSQTCSTCDDEKEPPSRGLSRAFCAEHIADIPARIVLHLDRSTRGPWFLAWWRLAKRELRTKAIANAKEYNKPRSERRTA